MKVRIPATKEGGLAMLKEQSHVLTTTQWARAAAVWAMTTGGGSDTAPPYSINALARERIPGLSETQIKEYRKAWRQAIDAGQAQAEILGTEIDLPDLPWKDYFGEPTPEVQERVAKAYIAKNPEVVVESIKALPAVKDAVADHVAGDTDLRGEVEHRAFEKRMGRTYTGPSAPLVAPEPFNHNREAQTLVFKLADALKQERDGVWAADGLTETLFRLLNITLNDRHKKEEPDIFDEINSHLAAAAQEGAA